jgi:DNA-binding PucR family transcriptional regulator
MADAVAAALGPMPVRTLVGIRDGQVIAIISATRRLSGWTAPQSALAERVYPALRTVGPAALIGLSNDVPSTSHIPRALREARIALELANVADRVIAVARVPFQRMLVASAGEDVRRALPAWLDEFLAVDRRSRGKLSDTLRAYADCDMNVLRTAKSLGIHPNTIYARMKRINDAAGMNPSSYHALTEILLAIEASASA